jgi:thioredoxin 1
MVTGVLIGLVLGAIAGHAKFRQPLLGGLVGAGAGVGVVFALGFRPSPVMAVETLDEFEAQVRQAERPVLVDFYSDRCQPCRKLAPTIEKLASEYKDQIDVIKIDVDDAPEIACQNGVRAIPTVTLFIDGRPTHSWVGNRPTSHYRTVLDAILTGRMPAPAGR